MGTNLKPWPENPHATVMFSESGWRAMTKCSSGVLEYMQVAACRHGPSSAGSSPGDPLPHLGDLVVVHRPVDGLRGADDAFSEERHLHAAAGAVDRGESVGLHAGGVFVDEDRMVDERRSAAARVEPVQHLPFDGDRDRELGEQLRRPCAGADDELSGGVGAASPW